MKKTSIVIVLLAIVMGISCPVMAEEITIVGSGIGTTVISSLGTAFSQTTPGVTVIVPPSIGSGGGIKAVGSGRNILGRVARKIKKSEKTYKLTYVPVAKIPVVFFVNKAAGIRDISIQHILDIYSGKITNWKEVGGRDVRIRVVIRQKSSSSRKLLLKSFPGFKDITITSKSKTTYSTPETLSVVESKSGTIGFGAYDVVKDANADVLMSEGKSPSDPDYPYFVTSALVFMEKNNTGNIRKFTEFVTSVSAHDIIRSAGGIPF
ncbi:substrate-binding domain-containing protein [Desulfonema magnum]|uniref:Periplasmic binding domain-containing protein n=1 Tax=Desulfonema magnum TaxID=45655 RepID=A0A975BH38_9BACT|nr:substrate-binding domain-containing protein [Desulfonema magnum]QTA85306.1 Periplasmic binding domain-containing protein [Desulfonema magnum]